MFVYGVYTVIAGGLQLASHVFYIQRLAGIQHQAAAQQKFFRSQPLQCRAGRNDQNTLLHVWQLVQGSDALGDDILVG